MDNIINLCRLLGNRIIVLLKENYTKYYIFITYYVYILYIFCILYFTLILTLTLVGDLGNKLSTYYSTIFFFYAMKAQNNSGRQFAGTFLIEDKGRLLRQLHP
jgi:hypothetical protein